MFTRYVLYGGGSFSVEVASYLRDIHSGDEKGNWAVSDVVSCKPPRSSDLEETLGHAPKAHADISSIDAPDEKGFLVCVGDAAARQRILQELEGANANLAMLVHPTAYVAASASIGAGTIICPFAFVGPFASVGRNCAINVRASVGHDALLGDSTVLSPGAGVSGHGQTGTAAFLGAGATINPKSALGSYSKLSAGSVLTKTVGDGFLMHGNPAAGRQMVRVG